MRKYTINNEHGMAALLSVIVLSMIMVSTLTSVYIYIENRARFQERLRMNYQTGFVMDDIGRKIVQSYEQHRLIDDGFATGCPSGSQIRFLDCSKVCAQKTSLLGGSVPAGTPPYAVCVKSNALNKIINDADFFCAYNNDPSGGVTQPSYCSAPTFGKNEGLGSSEGAVVVVSRNTNQVDPRIENWYAHLDKFFDTTIVKNVPRLADKMYPILESEIKPPTMLGWLLPEKVYAATAVDCNLHPEDPTCMSLCSSSAFAPFCKSVNSKVTLAKIDNGCSPTSLDPRCKKCAGTDRKSGDCLKVSICPPWLSTSACVASSGVDKRIQQMIRIK